MRWPLQPLQPPQPLQKTQLQPPFGPSVDSLCHPWFTTTHLSYRFPIFETSATALCGTTGTINVYECSKYRGFAQLIICIVFDPPLKTSIKKLIPFCALPTVIRLAEPGWNHVRSCPSLDSNCNKYIYIYIHTWSYGGFHKWGSHWPSRKKIWTFDVLKLVGHLLLETWTVKKSTGHGHNKNGGPTRDEHPNSSRFWLVWTWLLGDNLKPRTALYSGEN